MSNVAAAMAAKAGGVAEAELAAIEESGAKSAKANYSALAAAVGLHPDKLTGIANGWLPAPTDLGMWRELRCITTTEESTTVNCYLAWDEVTCEAALFDTGWNADPIFRLISENQLQLRHIFITHSHEDHVAALPALKEKFPKVRIHSSSKNAPVDQRNRPNDCVQLGSLRIMNRDTPGHAEDGTTFVVGNWPDDAPHVAVVGDAIFAGSMGRGNPSWELARQKVREQIFTLPAETLICPGHGPMTTVAEQKAHNPFF
jgi:glyoxylase-like metal-dependent hydrolase (beta-lactamase superfamily II)